MHTCSIIYIIMFKLCVFKTSIMLWIFNSPCYPFNYDIPYETFWRKWKKNHYLTIWLSDVLQGMIKTVYAVI